MSRNPTVGMFVGDDEIERRGERVDGTQTSASVTGQPVEPEIEGLSAATARPWHGRMDGLVVSTVGNVRFVLRIERHGDAATLDEEDRACLDLVLAAVNAYVPHRFAAMNALVDALIRGVKEGRHGAMCDRARCVCWKSDARDALAAVNTQRTNTDVSSGADSTQG